MEHIFRCDLAALVCVPFGLLVPAPR